MAVARGASMGTTTLSKAPVAAVSMVPVWIEDRRRRALAHRVVHDPRGTRCVPESLSARGPRHGQLRGLPPGPIEERTYAFFPRLKPRRSQLVGTLSGGEQQMLAVARALATEPAALLLDEMSMGLAPLIVEELYGLVGEIANGASPSSLSNSSSTSCSASPTTPSSSRRAGSPPPAHLPTSKRNCRRPIWERIYERSRSLRSCRLVERVGSRRAVPRRRLSAADLQSNRTARPQVLRGRIVIATGASVSSGWDGGAPRAPSTCTKRFPTSSRGGMFGSSLVIVGAALFTRYSAAPPALLARPASWRTSRSRPTASSSRLPISPTP